MKELYEKRDQLRNELDELKARYAEDQSAGTLERMGNVKRAIENVGREIVGEVADNPNANELGTSRRPGPDATPALVLSPATRP